jgi:hypothetical protein
MQKHPQEIKLRVEDGNGENGEALVDLASRVDRTTRKLLITPKPRILA